MGKTPMMWGNKKSRRSGAGRAAMRRGLVANDGSQHLGQLLEEGAGLSQVGDSRCFTSVATHVVAAVK